MSQPSAVTVPAGRYVLRPWCAETDADAVLEAAADELVALWNPLLVLDASSDVAAAAVDWCRRRSDWSDGDHASWAVVDADAPAQVLGSISLHGLADADGHGRIGYWTLPGARRRGVARHALLAASTWAFTELPLHRIELFHAVDNPASCRTALAGGYALEGLHRASHRYGDGRHHDEHTHARLRADRPPTRR